jgi:Protein of unknown function (DUF1593)
MRTPCFLLRTTIASIARSASLTCVITLIIAFFSPACSLKADTQSGPSAPNPAAVALANAQHAQEPKFRFIYLDDAEIDGLSEFMRFLLYANDFADSLQGIVYTSSEFHYRGEPHANPPIPPHGWSGGDLPPGVNRIQTYQNIIEGTGYFGRFGGYAAAYPGLVKNDPRYPTPEHLLSLIKVGNVDDVGEMTKVTDGSTLVKNALLADDPKPLWLVTGGGTNTICAALSQLAQQYQNTPRWDTIRKHVIANTHVYIILNQDNTFADYIKVYWPDLDVVLNRFQFAALAYGWKEFTTTGEQPYLEAPFEARIARGPMLGAYPLASDGSFNSDGDAPMYFQLLPTGLRSIENPTWGGWGGRFHQVINNGWCHVPADFITPNDTFSDFPPAPPYVTVSGSGSTSALVQDGYPLARWIPAVQNDMLARSEWPFADYAHANHPPVVFITSDRQNISAAAGELVNLSGQATDPDGNQLSVQWWQYLEAGTYPKSVKIQNSNSLTPYLFMPADAVSGQTIHVILQVTDDGKPPLTRYQRVVITCK